MPATSTRDLGRLGEDFAAAHLVRRGYDVLSRNHQTRYGELDLVASDGRTLVFCEVKTRRVGAGDPFESLHELKRDQVRRIAAAWLTEVTDRAWHDDLRFDGIAVVLDHHDALVRLDHLEGCF
jgi:putative endonuclease